MIEDFLQNEFQRGAFVGNKPEQAFWVKCDRSTMTQNDLDNGRLIWSALRHLDPQNLLSSESASGPQVENPIHRRNN